jgi:hypothetical protein
MTAGIRRGRPKKVIRDTTYASGPVSSKTNRTESAEEDLTGHEAVQRTIAEILAARCGIPGCSEKHHEEESGIILRKMIRLDLLKDD